MLAVENRQSCDLTTVKLKQDTEIDLEDSSHSPDDTCHAILDSYQERMDIDLFLLSSFRHTLNMYNLHMRSASGSPDELVYTGGLQQYLIRQAEKHKYVEQPRKCSGSSPSTTFHDLPDSLQLEIFSYVGVSDLCRICCVCRHWHMLTCDDLLWQKRLAVDVRTWSVVGHTSYPDMYAECKSDWTQKEIYLRCSPEVNQAIRQSNTSFHQLSGLLRSFLPGGRRTPKLAMFGPGLESSTSSIVRKIISDITGAFKVAGMFPGQFDGVGSGFTMRMQSAASFNLMALYTTTRQQRQDQSHNQRRQHNRMLVYHQGDDQQGAAGGSYELRQPIKELCRSVDGFIFVVDASQTAEEVSLGRHELSAMLSEVWLQTSVPVLILSCVSQATTSRLPCIEVARHLQLGCLNRPWQVHDCVVDNNEGLIAALEWAVGQAQRR